MPRSCLTLLSLAFLSACVASGPTAQGVLEPSAVTAAAPRTGTYRCEDGSDITVQSLQSSVMVTDADGQTVGLPASSAADDSARYGSGPYALVIEQGEALWMKAGEEPHTCARAGAP